MPDEDSTKKQPPSEGPEPDLESAPQEREWWQTDQHLCLRCKTVPLTDLGSPGGGIAFFECPECQRHYALQRGSGLTFRWLHPISLALYDIQFDESPPPGRAEEMADSFIRSRPEQLEYILREILLELEDPTQQVRDMVGCRASESDLRAYLREVADRIATALPGARKE